MKRIILSILFILGFVASKAQYDTILVQDFNTSCASASGFPPDWIYANPVTGTTPNGQWQCTPTNGRWSTPGMQCTGTWGSLYHLDTSYLITPALDISRDTGSVYLQFDTKTTNINLGGRLSFIAGMVDTLFGRSALDSFTTELTNSLDPVFTSGDSSDWVTHEIDLTPYKSFNPFYIAFMYVSTTTSGSTWYLDNIQTTAFPTRVSNVVKNTLPLTIIGNSTSSEIAFSYNTGSPGVYHLSVYDVIGHKIYESDINALSGRATYTITGLSLHSGMYLVKMGNGEIYGTVKTIIP